MNRTIWLALGVGLIFFGITMNASVLGLSVLPTCAPAPYPNPPIPSGATLTTNGNLIGYYSGNTFTPYNGYLSGIQVVNGLGYACSLPVATTTTSTTITTTTTTTTQWPVQSGVSLPGLLSILAGAAIIFLYGRSGRRG